MSAINDLNHRLSPRQLRAACLIAFGEFIDGYDLLVMGAALIVIRGQFDLSATDIGLLGAATYLGAIVGLLVFGDLSDRLGRRAIFLVNLIFFVVFALASAFVTQSWELFLTRFLVGVGVGMDIPTSTAYLAEIAPAKRRGALLGSLLNVMWTLGALTSTLLAIPLIGLLGNDAWRWMLGLAAVPAALVLFARRNLPESPRWLMARGRVEEARAALAYFGVTESRIFSAAPRKRVSYRDLLKGELGRRILIVSCIFFLNCFSGSLTTIAAPLVLKTVGALSTNASLLFSASIWVTALAGTAVSSVLIDRLPRRTLAYISTIGYGLVALVLAMYATRSAVILVTGFYLLSFLTWAGIAVLTWTWASELFPTELRGRAQGLCNGACRLAAALNIFIVPTALATIGFGAYMALLALPMFLIAIVARFQPILDSGGASLEQLEQTPC